MPGALRNHIVSLWIAILLLTTASVFAVMQSVDSHNHQDDSLHNLICFINSQEQTAKSRTAAEKKAQATEISKLLHAGNLKPCAEAKHA